MGLISSVRTTLCTTGCVMLGLAAAIGGAHASPVTVNWTGTITKNNGITGIELGDPITGSFTYDSSTPASLTSFFFSRYDTNHSISFTLGSLSGTFSGQDIAVQDNVGGVDRLSSQNRFSGFSYSGDLFDGIAPNQLFLTFFDSDASAFSSSALPTSLNPLDFDFANPTPSRFDVKSNGASEIEFITTGFTASPTIVPVPAALPLLLTGIGAVAWLRRRKTSA